MRLSDRVGVRKRKYIIVQNFAWTSFWDISFGNRIRFWEFAQDLVDFGGFDRVL